MRIVKQLENKKFEWTGFENNCEAFARALVNDTPVSTQGEKVTKFTKLITKRLLRLAAPKGFYESSFSLRYARQVGQAAMRVESKGRTTRPTLTPASVRGDGPSTEYYRSHPEAAAKKVRHQAEINRRPSEKDRRVELNRERRRRGIYGKGGPDVSHTSSGDTVLEAPSKNRARNGEGGRRLKADSPWAVGFDAAPCWEGYQQIGMKRKGKKRVPNCVPVASKDAEDGKKYTKVVTNPETGRKNKVRYGAKGYSIAPGTDKGDRYCARSFGDMKSEGYNCAGAERNTPLCLSRAKWKCSGKSSRRDT